MVFANPEEELIVAESELCIDYEVDSSEEDDSALGTEGVEMKPWRRFESLMKSNCATSSCQDCCVPIWQVGGDHWGGEKKLPGWSDRIVLFLSNINVNTSIIIGWLEPLRLEYWGCYFAPLGHCWASAPHFGISRAASIRKYWYHTPGVLSVRKRRNLRMNSCREHTPS